jgi:GTP-binding protein
MFVDYVKIYVKAGDGGKGCVAFRREKYVPKGGPSGGDGGKGGNVIVRVDPNLFTLQDLKYRKSYKAQKGSAGQGSQKSGKNGASVIIPIPPGTVIMSDNGKKVVADLIQSGQTRIIAVGGKGGRGNMNFATPTNRAPRYAEDGIPGEEKELIFELKVISDVGLVGLPNSGKSTLLSKLSRATPKIANYPFTTLQPHLGIVKYDNYRSFVMADIPGIIEGAHQGKGLGYRFLRHLERTRVFAFLIESTDPDPLRTYQLLNHELIQSIPGANKRPRIVLFTKNDLNEQVADLQINQVEIVSISAVTGKGLENFVERMVNILNESA